MNRIFLSLSALFLTSASTAFCQAVSNPDDQMMRGWYDRPWQRYEAEPELCDTNGEFLLPPDEYSQTPLQSEASNTTALSLLKVGDAVSWIVDKPGRGVTLRFSLPDAPDGKGLKGYLQLCVSDGRQPVVISLDSFWAWQYTTIANTPEKYPDNSPSDLKFARMRFDEVRCLLDEDIPSGAVITLEKMDGDGIPYTIDFIELEPVGPALTIDDIDGDNKVEMPADAVLANFVAANQGKTIFVPAGFYACSRPVNIMGSNTRIIGAGIWYTTINFTAPSDNRSTYSARGFHTQQNNTELAHMSINTVNNVRYFQNNPSFQVGKGLNGSWGSDSYVHDVIIEHFECGGWIAGGRNLRVERARLRNNYADGINLAGNSSDCTVTRCSFRNNGDDDMASWSTGSMASSNEFSFCTAENNWRASSLGFFGGKNQSAHHITIYDAMECGARVTCDFAGTGFSNDGQIHLHDITIRRCGSKRGTPGEQGGFWGSADAALNFSAGYAYDLRNVRAENIDVLDSRDNAVAVNANSGKSVSNLELHNISIRNVGTFAYGLFIASSVKGNGHWSNISCENVQEPWMSNIPAAFDFTNPESGIQDFDSVLMPPFALSPEFLDDFRIFDLSGTPVDNPENFRGIGILQQKTGGRTFKFKF